MVGRSSRRATLTFGHTGDHAGALDLDVLAAAIAQSLDELVHEARTHAWRTRITGNVQAIHLR